MRVSCDRAITPTVGPRGLTLMLATCLCGCASSPASSTASGESSKPVAPATISPDSSSDSEVGTDVGRGPAGSSGEEPSGPVEEPSAAAQPSDEPVAAGEPGEPLADVLSVRASGGPGAYTFAVRLRSPDAGCDRYANFWEVLSLDGTLVYRRILAHSHVNEQPFTRSGGPVPVARDTIVLVRAHLAPGGYGGGAMRGSVAEGFKSVALAADFAVDVLDQAPHPTDCAF